MSRYSVILDANILFSGIKRDILLRVAMNGLYRPRWSSHVLGEVKFSLAKFRNASDEDIDTIISKLNKDFPDALIYGYKPLIAGLELPDANDRHILAAAIRGRCDGIVTENIRDFPKEVLGQYGLDVARTDDFLCYQMDIDEPMVIFSVLQVLHALKKKKKKKFSFTDYLSILRKDHLTGFANRLERLKEVFEFMGEGMREIIEEGAHLDEAKLAEVIPLDMHREKNQRQKEEEQKEPKEKKADTPD